MQVLTGKHATVLVSIIPYYPTLFLASFFGLALIFLERKVNGEMDEGKITMDIVGKENKFQPYILCAYLMIVVFTISTMTKKHLPVI